MNRVTNQNQTLFVNIFGLELDEKIVFRQNLQIKLIDQKSGKDFILTTMTSRGRGSRASKQKDNFILLDKFLKQHAEENSEERRIPVFAYDGAQSLFSLEPICGIMTLSTEEILEIEGLSEFVRDSVKYLSGSLEVTCDPDCEKPSFNQVDFDEWEDSRFYTYLDIVTSQGAIRSGKYLSQSKGLYVYTNCMEKLRVDWAFGAKGVHKGCRIVGEAGRPLPILELDPQATQYYAPITLDKVLFMAFSDEFSPNSSCRLREPSKRTTRAAKLLFRDLKCNPFYTDIQKFATNTITVYELDFNEHSNKELNMKHPNLKFPHLPAASCCAGPYKKLFPLEHLRIIPYQSLDRRVLEEFKLTPRANAPRDRWADLQNHFVEFNLKDDPTIANFGIRICNDPFNNVSEISGDRVDKPEISYARPVHVDDEKRDWKAREQPFVDPSRIDVVMVVLIVANTRNFNADIGATKFVVEQMLHRCCDKGMQIGTYEFRKMQGEQRAEQFLTLIFRELIEHPSYNNPKFNPFVLLVSDDVPNIHECLKFEERMSDIPTQHILLKNIRKIRDALSNQMNNPRTRNHIPFDLTLDNIVMKVNIKSGGVNYTSDIPNCIECWRDVSTFVVGLDVAHPDKMAKRDGHPSTVGLSCNSGDNPYSFIGDFAYTMPRKEVIDDEILRTFTSSNMMNFVNSRGFPKKIIIFRDGVSFGEESEAAREAKIIEETVIAMASEQGIRNYKPSLLVVVVKKRHHTRFYAKSGYGGGQPMNPLPDTAVCGEIAEYGKRQIFIQAFRPVQGTAKVPSFLVIRDDDEVTDEHISKLVCAVCSLHQLVNSPTSIPTPVFVAHELAKRGAGLFKAYRFKHGDRGDDWRMLTCQLSYSTLDRLSKVRVV